MTTILLKSYPIMDIRTNRGVNSEYRFIPASTTLYIPIGAITHLDSVYGIDLFVRGLRGGANEITISIEHAAYNDDTATWAEIGTGTLGSGGDGGVGTEIVKEVTVNATPTAPVTLKNYIRVKIVSGAATDAYLAIMTITRRGGEV
jgi:hypothetical protein